MIKSKSKYKNRIRVVLAEKVITNHWIADKMGVSDMTVSRWTTNKIQPSMSQFIEISNLLNVDVKELIEYNFANALIK
ncbi:MAG: helix-turn-helix transcriptional regulator [Bacteroides sp.]|nr:helix-turn-helix transcriptional regulator [Bacteroides sp.]